MSGVGYAGRYYQFGNNDKQIVGDSPQLNVFSYNVRLFNRFKWQGNTSTLDSIFDFMAQNKFNLICLQEFYNHPEKQEVMKNYMKTKLPDVKYSEISYYFRNSKTNRVGLAILSKYPIIRTGDIQFQESNNAAVYSDILFEKDTIRIYNIHLQSISLKYDDYRIIDSLIHLNPQGIDEMKGIPIGFRNAYKKRATQALNVSNHIKQSPYPVVLCGDFNDTPLSYTYQKILGNMKDAYRESGIGTGQTYKGKLPSYRIDYIFYSDYFTSSDFETLSLSLSDHYPITSNLSINKNQD